MIIVTELQQLRDQVKAWRRQGQVIGFVPTMGNLHEGHIALVEQARRNSDKVIVSIFVNPMQFGENEDLANYPRTLEQDQAQLEGADADLLFFPDAKLIYPKPLDQQTKVEVPGISNILCGAHRIGHFTGVTTIVNKLFNLVQADKAWFGQKDYQQLAIICQMVDDLNIPIEVFSVATVRENDGLAKSSRNGYLNTRERKIAPELARTLAQIVSQLHSGGRDFIALQQQAIETLQDFGFRVDYVSILTPGLASAMAQDKDFVVLAAAALGSTRLIDNMICQCTEQ